MTQNATDTASVLAGIDQEEAARAAEAAAQAGDGTATGKEAGEELTEEQKAAKAAEEEAARKAEEVRKSKEHTPEAIQKRIDKENRRRKEAEERERSAVEAKHKAELEAAELKGRLAGMQEKGGSKEDPNAPPVRPKIEDFESVQDFNTALLTYTDEVTAYTRKQLQAETDKKIEEFKKTIPAPTPAETPQQKAVREANETNMALMEKVRAEYGDDAVETLTSPVEHTEFRSTAEMRAAIIEKGETAVKILGFFAENPKAAAKIAAMSVPNQIREIDKLETSIMAKKTTQAPPPTTPVDGKGKGDEAIPDDTEALAALLKKK